MKPGTSGAPPALGDIPVWGGGVQFLSHDLRSALSDVLGALRLIDPDALDGAQQAHLERARVAAETLARLLDKASLEESGRAGADVTRAVDVSLPDFLEDIRLRWAGRAAEKGLAFHVEAAPDLPAIVTLDRVALERVLANLLDNAVKCTERGAVRLSVRVAGDGALELAVSDDGPGIDPALVRRIGLAGESAPEDRPAGAGSREPMAADGEASAGAAPAEAPAAGGRATGGGLGLVIARELAALLGGRLTISPRRPGPDGSTGTDAVLTLPPDCWFDRDLRHRSAPAAPARGEGGVDLTGLKILVAEDNTTNQLVATQMLEALGARHAVAADGVAALEALERERFDLALLDIEMPRMSGLEVIRAIRARDDALARMPLVALTAYVMREHRERILAAGADGIIAKPLMSIEDLGRAILDHLGRAGNAGMAPPGAGPTGTGDGQAETRPDAAAAGGADGAPIVDRAVFDGLIGMIGPDQAAELLEKLQEDTDSVAATLQRARAARDLGEIRAATHVLISVAGAVGATVVQEVARRLNQAANRAEDAAAIDALCGDCLATLARLQEFIRSERARGGG